jgi:Ca2+-binding RTX toxin-like protein
MAKIFEFTPLTLLTATSILDPGSESLVYTPLGLNVSSRRFDSDGNPTADDADTEELLIGYNTTTVPPLDPLNLLGAVNLVDILLKNGNSESDSLRATSGNDIVYWDYATMFSLVLSVPVGAAVLSRYNLPYVDQNAAIEVFDLGGGDDILNLTHYNGQFLLSGLLVDPMAYGFSATAYGGDGHDVLWSGNQIDLLSGDTGDDTLHGGGGDDTVIGGAGMDTLSGGDGHDLLLDTLAGAIAHGGGGNDTVELAFQDSSQTLALSTTDEGNDAVFVSGNYASTSFDLGDGQDRFVASDVNGLGNQADLVSAGTGDDLVSSWYGDDVLHGDTADSLAITGGNDVLWGGAGSDTIYGGPGDDILYGGAGDGDVLVGGTGIDRYYWARSDGDDMIDDADSGPLPTGGAHVNAILVQPDFATETVAGSDGLLNGSGVLETDHDLYDNAGGDDMVQIVDVGPVGGTMELHILNGTGAGNVMTFEQEDISVVALWNNDAALGTPVITQYVWDSVDQRYEYAG